MKTSDKNLNLKLEIENRNKIWKKSTKRQKAVLLAKDVIERLNARQLTAETGVWLAFKDIYKYDDDVPIQECILGEKIPCRACAMGGLMMSTIAYRNRVTAEDLWGDSLNEDADEFDLSEAFSEAQLELIELAYEGGQGGYDFEFDSFNVDDLGDDVPYLDDWITKYWITKYNKACKSAHDKRNMRIFSFYKRYKNDDARRMKIIMQNIIKNKGLFVI